MVFWGRSQKPYKFLYPAPRIKIIPKGRYLLFFLSLYNAWCVACVVSALSSAFHPPVPLVKSTLQMPHSTEKTEKSRLLNASCFILRNPPLGFSLLLFAPSPIPERKIVTHRVGFLLTYRLIRVVGLASFILPLFLLLCPSESLR